jgi:amidase
VPIAVKDLCDVEGVPTTAGISFLADKIPDHDATVVKRLKAAGAIILGKLNMTEGAMAGYHRDFRVPKNPWDASVWTGASSSGSGVATAAGLAFATLGSDTGGSIRFPSACCGIVGLKPTWGRVSRAGVFPLAPSMDHIGPMARSTADCAMMLEAIAGQDARDPTSLIDPVPSYTEQIGKPVHGLVIGWDEHYASEGVDAELSAALRRAVDVLENLGARIKNIRLPDLLDYAKAWGTLGASEALQVHREYFPERRKQYGRFFRTFLDIGAKATGSEYSEAHQSRLRCRGELRKAFASFDILACPTMGGLPMKMTENHQYDAKVDQFFSKDMDWGKFTGPFDFTGQPTLSTPCGISSTGLPLSLQLVGKHLKEGLLCRVGHAFEQATGFNQLHPDITP